MESNSCAVCGDVASGTRYGIVACLACSSFFKRSLTLLKKNNCGYVCEKEGHCEITKETRNNCQFCRYEKYMDVKTAATTIPAAAAIKSEKDVVLKVDNPDRNVSPPQQLLTTPVAAKETSTIQIEVGDIGRKYVTEHASRILFSVVSWVKRHPVFRGLRLSEEMQLSLLKSCWIDLFTIELLKWRELIINSQLQYNNEEIYHHHHRPPSSSSSSLEEDESNNVVSKLQQFFVIATAMNLDNFEHNALKLLALVSPDRTALHDDSIIAAFKETRQLVSNDLQKHVELKGKNERRRSSNSSPPATKNVTRLSELLLLLPSLRLIDWPCMKTLFFTEIQTNCEDAFISFVFRTDNNNNNDDDEFGG